MNVSDMHKACEISKLCIANEMLSKDEDELTEEEMDKSILDMMLLDELMNS